MNLQEIMDEANVLVPNSFTTAQKISWLNELNRTFFEVVKIPLLHFFSATAGTSSFTMPSTITVRNVDRVMVGTLIYRSFQMEDVPPGNAGWSLDETTYALTLHPAPSTTESAYVRFMRAAATTYTTTTPASQTPEAPTAYHEFYIYGLAEKMALSMDDTAKANNFGQQYRSLLVVAQSNYVQRDERT